MVSAKDEETKKWLGQVVAGNTPTSSTTNLVATSTGHGQVTSHKAAYAQTPSPIRARPATYGHGAAQNAASLSSNTARNAETTVGRRTTMPTSASNNSLGSSANNAAQRASRLAAGAAADALYHPRQAEPEHKPAQLSNAGAAASLAAAQRPRSSSSGQGAQGLQSQAGRAALLAARDSKSPEIEQHRISQNAGRAALLAAHDSKPYEVPEHKLSAQAGRAALLANDNATPYEVPEHKLSAYAGKAALQAHQDPVNVEVPKHRLSQSASTAALSAYQDPVTVKVERHELSENAGKAALLAHHDYQPVEVPVHQLSANAGKAALLAHNNPDVQPQPRQNLTSEASARNALKAATQVHHESASRRSIGPEDLQAKGAANALKAATQAHHERAEPFKYVHPSDDEHIGALARANTRKHLSAMEPRAPSKETLAYANLSYANAQKRQSQAADDDSVLDEYSGLPEDEPNAAIAAHEAATRGKTRSRAGTATSQSTAAPVDLMALARKNVDSAMAARGMSMTAQDASPAAKASTEGGRPAMAHRASSMAFKDGQERAVESAKHREQTPDEREIAARIAREMAQFDQQRKRNQNNPQMQSALMEAARRNAAATLAQMEKDRPYQPPNLQDIARLEDALNAERVKARKEDSGTRQVDIGGGHFMSQAEIEAVAAKRVQPVFDEMDERVAAINQRKAEIKAREEAEKERKATEKAERQKQKELEKERARNTKIAEREAKEEAKREAAEKKAAEEEQKRKERAEQEKKRQETLAAERAEREAAAKKKEEDATLARTDSANAVATAAAESSSVKGIALPGTNAPLPGQQLLHEDKGKGKEESGASKATAVAPVEPISEVVPVAGDVKPSDAVLDRASASPAATSATASKSTATAVAPVEPISNVVPVSGSVAPSAAVLERTETVDSRTGEPLATYVVDHRGMTDTEGETDDEWADAVESTPAMERSEPSYAVHLAAAQARQPGADGDEASSVKTAKPARAETLAVVPEGAAVAVSGDKSKDLAPPIVKVAADLSAGVVEQKTKFKEEFA